MGFQQNVMILIVVVLVALALYFALSTEAPEPPPVTDNATEAESLLMKGIEFGKGHDNYVFSYAKIADGYETTYKVTQNEQEGIVEVQNPLSSKRIYFLSNDTILCIRYPDEETCSSVKDDSRLENYLESLKVEFFSDSRIEKNKRDMEYLVAHGYASLEPEIKSKTVGTHGCDEISYTLDYSNITLSEAARFGIGADAPRVFERSMCVDNKTGYRWEETMNYTLLSLSHTYIFRLLSFESGSVGTITPPENLTEGAVDVLFEERKQLIEFAECFTTKEGEERERCIATMALQLRRTDLCELAGGRKDRCLVSLVPLLKDEAICTAITDPSYKDDCYIELAGAYKDSSYCDNIQDASKIAFCMEAATPPAEEPIPEELPEDNETMNDTNESGVDILDFMEYIDQYDSDENQTENESNSTG